MADKRGSDRVRGINQRKVLDEASRSRRLRKAVENLYQDNFHEDPHANIEKERDGPKFEDTLKTKRSSKKKIKTESFNKQRCQKNFAALLEDEAQLFVEGRINYLTALAPPSKRPPGHYCAVCGFESNYKCVQCGARYCSIHCLGVHRDTRCLKWTV